MRQPRLKAPPHLEVAYYHCVSRVVNREFVLGDKEREMLVHFMRTYERLCGLRVVTFCIMSNHFHILVEVPRKPEGGITEVQLLALIGKVYGKVRAHLVSEEIRQFREVGAGEAAQVLIDGWISRMWDVSQFMKTLKQRFTQWFNKTHQRKGTLWEDRFRSVLVEGGGDALAMIAAYIDLNPVRAGIVTDPKDYRWCGCGEATAGIKLARDGLLIACGARQRGAGKVHVNNRNVLETYRSLLFTWGVETGASLTKPGAPLKRGFKREHALKELNRGGKLSRPELLRCRVRYFTDGAVIGGRTFVNAVFNSLRDRFGPNREDGARRMRGLESDGPKHEALYTLRDLQVEVFA